MTATKRQDEGGASDDGNRVKKIKGPDNSSINTLVNALFYSISTFVSQYSSGAPYAKPRKNDHMTFFDSLTTGDCIVYLKSKHPGAKEAIILAAIWNKLISCVLSAPMKAFIHGMPEYTMKNRLPADEFHAWRVGTAHSLSNAYKGPVSWGVGGDRRMKFVEEMVALLLDHSVIQQEPKLQSGLDGIADHVFQLACALARSRAYWVCTMVDPRNEKLHGFKVKTDRTSDSDLWDEDEGHGKSTIVELVKTPMLLKFGNSDGQNYDQRRVFAKAEVVVKLKKTTE